MSRSDVIEIFNAAVAAVHPRNIIPAVLRLQNGAIEIANETIQLSPGRKVFLLSVGKAASAMALEAEKILYNSIAAGLVVTKYHHSLPLQFCTTIEAAHPVPDENSVKAAYSIKHFLRQLRKDDLLLCFISGGASALIGDWKESMTLEDAKQITQLLLQCGATIHELNTLRKHLCFLKGGQLLEHCNGAAVYSFIMSDVPGDDFSIIASGLTVADASTAEDALRILQKYELLEKAPAAVLNLLVNEKGKSKNETTFFGKVSNTIIANNKMALDAAATHTKSLGYEVVILNENLEGNTEDEARKFVHHLLQSKINKPTCFLMGGETTVIIKGSGKGGRNQQFSIAALHELMNNKITDENFPIILAAGTDGTDGPTEAAGAVFDKTIIQKIQERSLNVYEYLENNDACNFFQQTNSLLITGPTQTNVMDIVIALKKA